MMSVSDTDRAKAHKERQLNAGLKKLAKTAESSVLGALDPDLQQQAASLAKLRDEVGDGELQPPQFTRPRKTATHAPSSSSSKPAGAMSLNVLCLLTELVCHVVVRVRHGRLK
jgi:hypothetical protein